MVGAVSLGITEITYSSQEDIYRWALMSDTHIPANGTDTYRGFSMIENINATVPDVVKSKPNGIIITGDIARLTGEVKDYRIVKEYVDKLSLQAPVYMALGNHDHLENFYSVFSSTPGEKAQIKGKHVTIINSGPIRLILLDSLQITNYTPGLLGKAQRQWLGTYLDKAPKKSTLLFLHHSFGDDDGNLLDDLRFFKIILPHRHVKAVFYGHSHRYHFSKQDDLDLINLPSTAYNFDDASPVGWVSAEFTATGVSLKLNAVSGNRDNDGKVTKIKWRC